MDILQDIQIGVHCIVVKSLKMLKILSSSVSSEYKSRMGKEGVITVRKQEMINLCKV